jgi:hypothetical protein
MHKCGLLTLELNCDVSDNFGYQDWFLTPLATVVPMMTKMCLPSVKRSSDMRFLEQHIEVNPFENLVLIKVKKMDLKV